MTKDIDLGALQALAEKATPGHWWVWAHQNSRYEVGPSPNCTVANLCVPPVGSLDANAGLIAAANPQTILSLIARIRELEGDTGKSAEACEYLTEYDFASLFRFNEICEDSDADGHDVPGAAMKRLEQIGVVRTMGFGRHEMTAFGHFVIEHTFLQKPTLPLRTHQDWNDIARRTASESTQPPQENTNV